jgi:polar amino acid transport system ATP-binding protein
MPDTILEAVNITKRFHDDVVLQSVNLEVKAGETVCIMGPSGSGKTTLLRCLNHLEKPTEGAVYLDGVLLGYRNRGSYLEELPERAIARQRRAVGMVFQSFNLFSHMSVMENIIEAPVHILRERKSDAKRNARDLLHLVGLAAKADAMPASLSGGQQQRVAIARALAMRPRVLLFDEPTSALDPELVSEVLDAIRNLAAIGTTMIIVTHELGFAREVATRAVFMDCGQIVEIGTVDQVLRDTSNERIRTFLSKVL